jgi:hypothetical protein
VPWSVQQVLGLAPDASAARVARELANRRAWRATGRDLDAVWGVYQGSAAQPYRTAIDFKGPAFSCSCPSPKVPCKHALGLFLLFASDEASIPPAAQPAQVAGWLHTRRESNNQRAKTSTTAIAAREATGEQSARTRKREERITSGVDDLDRWLRDLVRVGLAEVASRPWSSFAQMSARLVDAQAPGLARLVRDLGALPHTVSNWPERMLIDIGQLSLLMTGWRRLDALRPELQSEVRSLVGISEARDAVLARPAVHDVWDVLGRRVLEGERMLVQRTWLWGRRSKRWALLLDFSVGGQPIQQMVTPGLSLEADVHFYAGALPLRAVLDGERLQHVASPESLPAVSIESALGNYAEMLGRNPWLERTPVALRGVVPRRNRDDSWWLGDEHAYLLRMDAGSGWHVLALSGGQPLDVFGEWDGFSLVPLSVISGGELVPLHTLIEA